MSVISITKQHYRRDIAGQTERVPCKIAVRRGVFYVPSGREDKANDLVNRIDALFSEMDTLLETPKLSAIGDK